MFVVFRCFYDCFARMIKAISQNARDRRNWFLMEEQQEPKMRDSPTIFEDQRLPHKFFCTGNARRCFKNGPSSSNRGVRNGLIRWQESLLKLFDFDLSRLACVLYIDAFISRPSSSSSHRNPLSLPAESQNFV